MRAVVIHEYGGLEVLKVEERPDPAMRDTDILVEVHASSVNPVDTKVRQNSSAQRTLPLILGYDVSGVVVRCGARVTQWKPGDEIFAAPNLFRNGADADYVAIDARSAARKPASVDHATAASLPLVSQTAWEALHLRARSNLARRYWSMPAREVLDTSRFSLQNSTAAAPSLQQAAKNRLRSVGMCYVPTKSSTTAQRMSPNVCGSSQTEEEPRSYSIQSAAMYFPQSLDCAAINGQIVTILGSNSGDRGRGLLYRNVTIHYEFMGVPTAHEIEPERPGNILSAIGNLVDAGLLRPHVSHRFALEDLAEGHRQVETARTIGKVAIIIRP